jgi:hypothetical protein
MSGAASWAVIDNSTDIVLNIVLWDGVTQWTPPANCSVMDISGFSPQPGVNWRYDRANDVFLCPPQIYSVKPSQGPVAGGDSVTLTGVNFTGAKSVAINAIECAFSITSNTEIVIKTPAVSKDGQYQIIVSNSLQTGYPSAFTYVS